MDTARRSNGPGDGAPHRLFRRWTEPTPGLTDASERRSVRVLASVLLLLIALGSASAAVQLLLVPGFNPRFTILLGVITVLGVTYRLSLSAHHRVARVIACVVPVAAGGLIGLTSPDDPVWFAFMSLGVVLASAFLDDRRVGAIALVTVAATGLVFVARGQFVPRDEAPAMLSFTVILSALVVLAARHRSTVERIRQAEYEESQMLYRKLFENAPVGIGLATREGSLVAFNEAILRAGGYSRADMEALPNVALHYFDPETRPALMAQLEREGRVTAAEVRMRAKSGAPYMVSLSLVPITYRGQGCSMAIVEDITQRKRVEAERSRLAEIVERSLNEIYVFDTETLRFEHANEGARRNVRYPLEQLLRMTPLDLKPEFTLASFRALIDPLLRGDMDLLVFETVHRRADGSLYPVEVHLQLAGPAGHRVFLAVILDTTARKAAEGERDRLWHRLQVQEQRFSSLIEHSSDVIGLVGAGGELQHANPAFESVLGHRVRDWLGKVILDLVAPEDLPRAEALLTQSLAHPGVVIGWQLRVRHADGSFRWLEGTGMNHLADPAIRGIVLNCRDVTDRRQAEEVVQRNAHRLRVATEAADLAVFEMDAALRYTWVHNPPAGLPVERMIGRTDDELLGSDGQKFMAIQRRVLESGVGARKEVSVVMDGNLRWFVLAVQPIRAEDGTTAGLRGATLDITEAKAMLSELLQSQKMESVGRLAGGVAHDINNMLTPILGYAELLLMDLARDDARRSRVVEIRAAGERCRDLVRRLLIFARKQAFAMRPLDLNALVSDLEPMLRGTLREDISLEFRLAPGVGAIEGDAGQIEQALMNLVINAMDAMPHGGALVIETAEGGTDHTWMRRHPGQAGGPYVRLTVRDTGIGMDDATRSRLFEPFFTTKPPGLGTGLGLSTAYGIVEEHKGAIEVDTAPGKGTSIHLFFPRSESSLPVTSSAREPRAAPPAVIAQRGRGTLLVVEDDEPVRRLAVEVLREAGYTVLEAGDARSAEGVSAVHRGPIDLLLADVVLPGENGRVLHELLAAQRPGLCALFMSGYAADVVAPSDVRDAGAGLVQKPFTPETLVEAVGQALERAHGGSRAEDASSR